MPLPVGTRTQTGGFEAYAIADLLFLYKITT